MGFHTLMANDGAEAVDIVRRHGVDLLVTDMHMPRMTGLEAIRRVKQVKVCLPCILISAGLDDLAIEEARRVAFSVLAKPVRFADVRRTVHAALRDAYGWPEAGGSPRD